MSKKSIQRTVPILAGIAALTLAAACGKGDGGSARVNTRGAADTKAETNTILSKTFNGKYNSNDADNMVLARKVEGASASAVPSAEVTADGKPMFDVHVKILVSEEAKAQPALIVEAAGSVSVGEKATDTIDSTAAVVAPAPAPSPTANPDQQIDQTKTVKRPVRAQLQFVGDSSDEATKRFTVYGFCVDDKCAELVVMLKELAQTDATSGKLVTKKRHTAFRFKRAATVTDGSMTLVWSGNVDPKNLSSGTKLSFDAAADSRVKQGFPIAAPISTPKAATPDAAKTPAPVTPPEAAMAVDSGNGDGKTAVTATAAPVEAAPVEAAPAVTQTPAPVEATK